MLDDFFVRALLAGIGVALVAAPFGCFIVWRRLAYFGDTLAHSALLGVALAVGLEINLTIGVFVIASLVSLTLFAMQNDRYIPSDALLGTLSHAALAIGLVALAFMTWVRVDLTGLLFGDILSVTKTDLLVIAAIVFVLLSVLAMIWRPLFAATVNVDLAKAEGVNTGFVNLVHMLLMAVLVAVCMKLVGVLLITALLVIPAVTVRPFSTSPEVMAIGAGVVGVISVVAGLMSSLQWDTPSGPSVVVAAFVMFVVSLLINKLVKRRA